MWEYRRPGLAAEYISDSPPRPPASRAPDPSLTRGYFMKTSAYLTTAARLCSVCTPCILARHLRSAGGNLYRDNEGVRTETAARGQARRGRVGPRPQALSQTPNNNIRAARRGATERLPNLFRDRRDTLARIGLTCTDVLRFPLSCRDVMLMEMSRQREPRTLGIRESDSLREDAGWR
ncbi:hypothetical protein J6590_001919 [Homalodisca vitripennis]|nr:hypothetical protein J6590_001919 [Homalodisca vitripennis]